MYFRDILRVQNFLKQFVPRWTQIRALVADGYNDDDDDDDDNDNNNDDDDNNIIIIRTKQYLLTDST
jgi:hypothetical protein